MKRKLLVAVPLLCLVALLAWFFRPKHEIIGEGYVSDRNITLWSSVAQVREPVGVLHYGEHVDIIGKRNENAKIRTASGAVGWVDSKLLIDPALWQRSVKLIEQARGMTAQSHGRTKVATNSHVQPGRTEPRLYQFTRGVAVEVLARAVADKAHASNEKESPGASAENKKEDWYLVRGIATRPAPEITGKSVEPATTQQGDMNAPVVGWVVARFIELDLPGPVREGMASANVRTVAWFELNRVSSSSGDKPQYLVAGTRNAEGQPCDFTTLRVYTWNSKKTRYETAFIENNLCGGMPIKLSKTPKGEPEFRFHVKDGNKEERVYRLMQTVVRRIREGSEKSSKGSTVSPAKIVKK
jgi:hypothetical protein